MLNLKDFVDTKFNNENVNLELTKEKYFIAVGRLTRQKKFTYLINEFYNFCQNNDYNLLIFGNGEEKKNYPI